VQPEVDSPYNQPAYKILVDQDGLYQVSYTDLQAAGVPTSELNSLDPQTFQLFNQTDEVALYVEGEKDGKFHPTDYFLFYGQKVYTKFTDTNVYWLSWGNTKGLRMSP